MIKEIQNQVEWDTLVANCGGHSLQIWGWGELKNQHGPWTPYRLAIGQGNKIIGGAQILARKMPKPFKQMFYIPRGPFCSEENRDKVLQELTDWAKNHRGVELKIEPDWPEMKHWPTGWRHSKNRILVPKTALINLTQTTDEILVAMAKKTRQYIRKSENSGIMVRRITSKKDIAKCLEIYRNTADQRKFGLHDDNYYYDLARLAGDANAIYLAGKDGQPLSFLWNLRTEATEFELYGGVNRAGQELRSNYCLKWHAITEAKTAGIGIYDMNGLLNDGISNFKRSFTGSETEWAGTWDAPLSPLYHIWETALPVAKKSVQTFNKLRRNGHND